MAEEAAKAKNAAAKRGAASSAAAEGNSLITQAAAPAPAVRICSVYTPDVFPQAVQKCKEKRLCLMAASTGSVLSCGHNIARPCGWMVCCSFNAVCGGRGRRRAPGGCRAGRACGAA